MYLWTSKLPNIKFQSELYLQVMGRTGKHHASPRKSELPTDYMEPKEKETRMELHVSSFCSQIHHSNKLFYLPKIGVRAQRDAGSVTLKMIPQQLRNQQEQESSVPSSPPNPTPSIDQYNEPFLRKFKSKLCAH